MRQLVDLRIAFGTQGATTKGTFHFLTSGLSLLKDASFLAVDFSRGIFLRSHAVRKLRRCVMRDVAENGSLARFPLLLSSLRGSYIFNNSTPYLDQKKRKIFPSRNSFLLESCHEVQCEMDQS